MSKPKLPKVAMPDGQDARDCYATPSHIFAAAQEDAGTPFTVDAAADGGNALCLRYWDLAKNGLVQDWSTEIVWCNPPYSNIAPFIDRAKEAHRAALLLPVRSDRRWFRELAKYATFLDFYEGRIQFIPAHPAIKRTQNFEYSVLAWFYKEIREGQGAICRSRSAATGKLL